MTPKERVEQLFDKPSNHTDAVKFIQELKRDMADAIAQAVADAYEDAAKVAEAQYPEFDDQFEPRRREFRAAGREIAAAIRAAPPSKRGGAGA